MAQDVALFWIVLAGLFLFDNLVLIAPGQDCLRFGRSGKLRYKPGSRLQVLRRDMVFLNPLNPYDRIALTRRSIGVLQPTQWRSSVRQIQSALVATNRLSLVGSAYLLLLCVLAMFSLELNFAVVLLALALTHLAVWGFATWVLVRSRAALALGSSRTFALALEALLVPGYLVNLGKRVWYRQSLPLAGFTVGLRQLKRMPQGHEQELYQAQLLQQLDDIAFEMGLDEALAQPPSPLQGHGAAADEDSSRRPEPSARQSLLVWLQEARVCLTISGANGG